MRAKPLCKADDHGQRAGVIVAAGKSVGKRAAQIGEQIQIGLNAAEQKGAAMAQGKLRLPPQQQLSQMEMAFGSQVHRPSRSCI